jgi:hypothetical protein
LLLDIAQNTGMNWCRVACISTIALTVALAAWGVSEAWEYARWQGRLIQWDHGTIHRRFGGPAEEDRIYEIEFIREWEYRALKRTPGRARRLVARQVEQTALRELDVG